MFPARYELDLYTSFKEIQPVLLSKAESILAMKY
jgi:hypothetical protein